MKKNFSKKMSLNKETVANLNDSEMKDLRAGVSPTATCPDRCTTLGIYCTYGCRTNET